MRYRFAMAIIVLCAVDCFGQVAGRDGLQIDFTQSDDAARKATWSPADRLKAGDKGLGWEGTAGESVISSVLTQPLATGLSWRPAQIVSLTLSIGSSGSLDGKAYARYSADAVHWTDWQLLAPLQGLMGAGLLTFSGKLGPPPFGARDAYEGNLREYASLDVPWKSDEEAASKWMVRKEPNFFKDHIPFVGYVQFRFDAELKSGQHITSLDAETSYAVGGLSTVAKDPADRRNRDGPWRFKAAPATEPRKDNKP